MKTSIILISFLLSIVIHAQEDTGVKNNEKSIGHQNIIKFGSSIKAEIYSSYRHYDYYGYYYEDDNDYEGGPHVPVFVSFEHIWELENQKALSIEPMLGVSFRENLTGLFAGSEFKFYWVNTGFWRCGIAFNVAYSYGNTDTKRWISMDNGNYQQLKDLAVHYHIVSFDPGIIPFQFRIKNSPIVIENMFSLVGLNLITRTTDKFQVDEDTYQKISSFDVRPYFLKFELKVGFVLP